MAEIYKSLSIGNIQIMATFNFGNFQFWQLSILATFNFGNFQKIHKKSPYTLYNSYQGKIANFYNFG